jgi:hypothetical protein
VFSFSYLEEEEGLPDLLPEGLMGVGMGLGKGTCNYFFLINLIVQTIHNYKRKFSQATKFFKYLLKNASFCEFISQLFFFSR